MTDPTIFDFIVVGGGSAGCVLAARLSEDPSVRVLLVEAGPRDRSPLIHFPLGNLIMLRRGYYCWKYMTDPQQDLAGRVLYDPRGKVLGGTSSINGMIYDRGGRFDFDHWAARGNHGWSYREVLPYFRRSESFEPGADEYHGADGPLRVTRSSLSHPLSAAWCEAGIQAGFPFNPDVNGAERLGFGPTQYTISRGRRMSTAVAFLNPARARTNLWIRTGAQVSRVILKGNRARGIELLDDSRTTPILASREVILCAGVYNTPHLLQLSGIGPARELERAKIRPCIDLPGVGSSLHDHLAFSIQVTTRKPISHYGYIANPLQGARSLVEYAFRKTGPLSAPPVEAVALVNSNEASRTEPDIKFHLVLAMYAGNGQRIVTEHGFLVRGAVHRPESRGTVRAVSADPRILPNVNPNLFSCESDRRRCRDGFRLAREFVAQQAFDDLRGRELDPGIDVSTDAELDAYVARTSPVDMHAVGSCPMGVEAMSVVSPELLVHGVHGLRIADASVMPRIVGANTNATTIMIAEKAADLALGKPALPPSSIL